MTRVILVSDAEAKGEAQAVFKNFMEKQGSVPTWARVMAHRQEILTPFAQLVSMTMGPGLVEQDNKWKMAYRVSHLNKCAYCISVVETMLAKMGVTKEEMADVVQNVDNLKPDEQIAVKYAEAITKEAANIPETVYFELKKFYTEDQLVEITAVAGLFNYINRFNDALGVIPG